MPLNALGKQGRYVRIQLLDKDYLSLAEVQVMGGSVDSLRFSEVDYSGAYNNFGGWYNAPNISNENAFAALKVDGSITDGVVRIVEAQVRPLIEAIPRFIQIGVPSRRP